MLCRAVRDSVAASSHAAKAATTRPSSYNVTAYASVLSTPPTGASARSPALTPWLWGVNGATSVCASVLAVVIALGFGISRAFWAGAACYALAAAAFLWASRRRAAGAA